MRREGHQCGNPLRLLKYHYWLRFMRSGILSQRGGIHWQDSLAKIETNGFEWLFDLLWNFRFLVKRRMCWFYNDVYFFSLILFGTLNIVLKFHRASLKIRNVFYYSWCIREVFFSIFDCFSECEEKLPKTEKQRYNFQ